MTQFGIYIHWPFCESKCPYCDFNSHTFETIDHVAWREAYLAELDRYAAETSDLEVTSIFFGGGTPSLMEAETVEALITHIRKLWPVSDDLEITAEANPSSAEMAQFEAFRAAGVTRLSLGMQALNEDDLIFLGRRHSADEAVRAATEASQVFERYSLDFIYARPGQTVDAWREELARILDLAGDHVSLYQLTIEPGTQFHKDRIPAAGEEIAVDLFELTQEMTAAAGLHAYEISNHARPGEECRHNLVYWRGEDYIGIGPGAHGRLSGTPGSGEIGTETVQEIRLPSDWLGAVQSGGGGTQKRNSLSRDERLEELILMGLRLSEGIDFERFYRHFGAPLLDQLEPESVARLERAGFLTRSESRLAATDEGRTRLDAVLAALLT